MCSSYVIANWKMNFTVEEAGSFLNAFNKSLPEELHTNIIVCSPFVFLPLAVQARKDSWEVGAQNVSQHKSGAFTGEISADMLASLGVSFSIVGHSERRSYFKEDNDELIQKIKQLEDVGLRPIFCVGELEEERKQEKHYEIVTEQLREVMRHFSAEKAIKWIVAYEPVWAIGTGLSATEEQVEDMHAHIRNTIASLFDEKTSNCIPILYGGSVKPDNAHSLFTCPNIDGALVGGASLKIDSFLAIVEATKS